jgi:hypothetical protein
MANEWLLVAGIVFGLLALWLWVNVPEWWRRDGE